MKRALFIFIATVMIYSSCKKIDMLTNFYMDYTSSIIIDPIQDPISNIEIWTYSINDSLSELCQANSTNKESIKHILLNRFSADIKSPDTMSFNFAHSINIYINSKGMEQKKIAWTDEIQIVGLQTLNFNVSDDDIKDYINNDFVLVCQLSVNEKTSNQVELCFDYTYLVTSNLN